MISNKLKNALAVANGLSEERKIELIRQGVREQIPHADDEIAMLRKAVAYLFDIIATLHEGELDNTEFAKYNALVEQIKIDAKSSVDAYKDGTA